MIAYVENSKDLQKPSKTNKFNQKITGCKINIQKSIIFLHSRNKYIESKIKNTILFAITLKKRNRYKSDKKYRGPVC